MKYPNREEVKKLKKAKKAIVKSIVVSENINGIKKETKTPRPNTHNPIFLYK